MSVESGIVFGQIGYAARYVESTKQWEVRRVRYITDNRNMTLYLPIIFYKITMCLKRSEAGRDRTEHLRTLSKIDMIFARSGHIRNLVLFCHRKQINGHIVCLWNRYTDSSRLWFWWWKLQSKDDRIVLSSIQLVPNVYIVSSTCRLGFAG